MLGTLYALAEFRGTGATGNGRSLCKFRRFGRKMTFGGMYQKGGSFVKHKVLTNVGRRTDTGIERLPSIGISDSTSP